MNSNKNNSVWGMVLALVFAIVLGNTWTVFGQGPADGFFELEGNIDNDGLYDVDWEDLFDVVGDEIPTEKADLPDGIFSASFVRDFIPGGGRDTSTYTNGSKDTLPISTGWACKRANNLGDKFDIQNAYAAAALVNGEATLYFGASRRSNEGTANIGFWFLQDSSVTCDSPGGGSTAFSGDHIDGDIFVVSEFSGGGGISTIKVFRWVGGANGSLDVGNVIEVSTDCKDVDDPDVCGTVNDVLITPPWLVESKGSGSTPSPDLDDNQFFEGKLNLSNLGLETCFNRFLVNTRSSDAVGSTIHDFAVGEFEVCDLDVTKECEENSGVINDDGTITYDISGTVTNSGLGNLFDVDVVCDNGTPDNSDDDFSVFDPPLAQLGPGESMNYSGSVTVDFQTGNGATIKATATAAAAPGGEVVATAESVPDQCDALAPDADISVTKNCSVIIVSDSECDKVVVRVDFDGEVCNVIPPGTDPDQHVDLNNVSVTDDNGTPDIPEDDQLVLNNVTLPPGECAAYTGSYFPTSVDGSNPVQASFTDTVIAQGIVDLTGAIRATQPVEATCDLCPEPAEP